VIGTVTLHILLETERLRLRRFTPADADLSDDRIESAYHELGHRLRRLAWGHGYATEGARPLVSKDSRGPVPSGFPRARWAATRPRGR